MTLPKCHLWYIKCMRKEPLVNGQYYHIISRSIVKYEIFNDKINCDRFIKIMDLYRYLEFAYKYSNFLVLNKNLQQDYIESTRKNSPQFVDIIAYCLMPTHLHLLLKQNVEDGIVKYLTRLLNSYTRYFNLHQHRKGPLWEGRFKNILVKNDEQLLHLTRYIHLNPVSAGLVNKPEDWKFSSYHEYLGKDSVLCEWKDIIDLDSKKYKEFVNDRISYQKELSKIKRLLNEDYLA